MVVWPSSTYMGANSGFKTDFILNCLRPATARDLYDPVKQLSELVEQELHIELGAGSFSIAQHVSHLNGNKSSFPDCLFPDIPVRLLLEIRQLLPNLRIYRHCAHFRVIFGSRTFLLK